MNEWMRLLPRLAVAVAKLRLDGLEDRRLVAPRCVLNVSRQSTAVWPLHSDIGFNCSMLNAGSTAAESSSINFSHDRTKAEQKQSFVKDTSDIITWLPLPCPCRRCRRAAALRRSFSTKPTARSDSIQPLRIESDELNKEYLSRDGSDIVRLQGWTELDPPFSSMNGAEGASVQQHSIHRCPRSISLVADENRSPQSSTSFWFLSRRLSKISLLLINY